MKTTLLTVCGIAAALSTYAIDEPRIVPSSAITGFSPDNNVAVSQYFGSIFFFDLESGEAPKIFSESDDGIITYSLGSGNAIGNNAICTSRGGKYGPSVWLYGASGVVNGRWAQISSASSTGMGAVNGVTPDGSRFCGTQATGVEFGVDVDGTMVVPCFWDRSGNTFTRTRLPYPEQDYLGLAPQYVTALCISDDGRTIIGQQRSNSGFINRYVLYRQDSDGNWTWSYPFESLFNPNHIEIPPYPGEGPDIPSIEAFMTEDELARYTEAINAYYENGATGVYPTYEEYMTAEEIAEYNEACKPYLEWAVKYEQWSKIDEEVRNQSVSFVFNQGALSPNGRYLVASSETGWYDEDLNLHSTYRPFLYDIEKGEIVVSDGPSLLVTSVSNEGDIVGYVREDDVEFGYALPHGSTEWLPLEKWVVRRNPALAQWVDDNWRHEIEVVIDEEEGITEYRDMYITGMPFMSRDFSQMSTVAYVFWNDAPEDIANDYVSYLLPLGVSDSIDEINEADAPAEYFNLQGIRVAEPQRGVYIRRLGSETVKILK